MTRSHRLTSRRTLPAAAALLLALCAPRGARAQWEPERTLGAGGFHGLAAAGRTVHVVLGTDPVQYRRSEDQGDSFAPAVTLADSGGLHPTGPVVAQGSSVYVAFFRNVRQATDWCCPRDLGDLYLLRSADGGLTWKPEKRLTTSGSAFRYELGVSGSRVHLVWSDYRDDRWHIYYRRSADAGATWDDEVKLVDNDGETIEVNRPQVAARGDAVHITWEDSRDQNPGCFTIPSCPEVYAKSSTDGGQQWGDDVRITYDGPDASFRPDVAVTSGGAALISYQSNREDVDRSEQWVVRSTDDGATWADPVRLTTTDGDSEHDTLLGDGSRGHITWSEDSVDRSTHTVSYRATLDDGATWGDVEAVSGPIGGEYSVIGDLAASDGFVHALWTDDSGSIQYARRPIEPAAAGPDAGPADGDAGGDPGASGGGADAGCACRQVSAPGGSGAAVLVLAVAWMLLRGSGRRGRRGDDRCRTSTCRAPAHSCRRRPGRARTGR